MQNISNIFEDSISEHLKAIEALRSQRELLERIASKISLALLGGKKVLWCGNGGSAADSQHLAAELVGRFRLERRGLPSIALTTNTSILTAIGNDYGFDHVFRRQIEAICLPGDVVVGMSTSGDSKNVCAALEAARARDAFTVGLTGQRGGLIAGIAHETLRIASNETPRIQEGHILCGHMLCDYVERYVCQSEAVEAISAQ